METTRRKFIAMLTALPLISSLPAFSCQKPTKLTATPPCDDHDEPTPSQTEGPFFTPESPERSSLLEKDITGTTLVLTGQVLNTDCQPVAGALLDWWHADDAGRYDNTGFRLRGHHYADEQGRFRLETIVPGLYTGRTRHLHVKVQAPGTPVLTTQLYFPGEPGNNRDGIFNPVLLMDVTQDAGKMAAGYTFVLKA